MVFVAVFVFVFVVAPGDVAARGSGNAAVGVIKPVNEHATCDIAEGCGRTARADKAKHYTIARGSAMECAAHLDVMKLDELLESESYAASTCSSASCAMLTKLVDP